MNNKMLSSIILKILLISILLIYINSKGILDYSHDLDSELDIQVGALSSINAIVPFSYEKLKICDIKKIVKAEDTLGEILTGEKIFNTGYIGKTGTDSFCEILCYNQFDQDSLNLMQNLINKNYFINWYLDKLPAGLINYDKEKNITIVDFFKGIPLGYIENNQYYIYNHLQFHILINEIDPKKFNIVGFQILPLSIKHNEDNATCSKTAKYLLNNFNKEKQILSDSKILFTYDIIFEKSNKTFAFRWDHYKISNTKIHWVGISLSESIILGLTIAIIIVLVKNIKNEIEHYNSQINKFQTVEYYSWKELSGDVFRAPLNNPMLLSAIVGNGLQLFCMITIILFLGTFGFLNPEKRSNILNFGIFIFCIMGIPGGYISSKIYQFFKGRKWILNSFLTSLILPGLLLLGYFFVNIILMIEKSSAAVHFVDIISLFFLWFNFTFPLIVIGSFFGFKTKTIKAPCKTNAIPSFIPQKPWYLHYKFMTFITGFFSFGTFFIELNFVMGALWRHQVYFLATFLWISFILFVFICAEISIIVIFWNLSYRDYNWWWKSFLIGASPVIYFVLFSIYYFIKLKLKGIAAIIVYFGIMGLKNIPPLCHL